MHQKLFEEYLRHILNTKNLSISGNLTISTRLNLLLAQKLTKNQKFHLKQILKSETTATNTVMFKKKKNKFKIKNIDNSLIGTVLQVRIEKGTKLKESLLICGGQQNISGYNRVKTPEKKLFNGKVRNHEKNHQEKETHKSNENKVESRKEKENKKQEINFYRSEPLHNNFTGPNEYQVVNVKKKSVDKISNHRKGIKQVQELKKSKLDKIFLPMIFKISILVKIAHITKDVRFRNCAIILARFYRVDGVIEVVKSISS